MTVAIIVAVLAAVAIPLMSGNKKRAMMTEAESALGSARSAMRAMYAKTTDYTNDGDGGTISAGDPVTAIPGIDATDFNGRYFQTSDYDVQAVAAAAYTLRCRGSTGDVSGVTITLDENGTFTRSGF